MFKVGETVAVCYDGKWGRRQEGLVVANCKGRRALVVFDTYVDNEPKVHWFRVKNYGRRWGGRGKKIAGYVPVEDSLMKALFGCPGDYYVVYKATEV